MTQILQVKTLLVIATIAGGLWLLVSQIESHLHQQEQRQQQIQTENNQFQKELEQKKKKAPVVTGFDRAHQRSLY